MRKSTFNRIFRIRFSLVVQLFIVVLLVVASQQSVRAQPMNSSEIAAKFRLAEVFEENRDLTNAVRVYEEIFHEQPRNREVIDALIRCYGYLKRFSDAEKLLLAEINTNGSDDFDLYLMLGKTEARLMKKSASMEAFTHAEKMLKGSDCMAMLPIASALADVSYNDEALELLNRNKGANDFICAGQIASLYLRMGKYGEATKQYLVLLNIGEANLGMVEQRLAQFTVDSMARSLTLDALRSELEKQKPSSAALQLLAWMYAEQHDYKNAYDIVVRIDDLNGSTHEGSQGYELLQFAERARAEGALDVAVKAYDEAIKRVKAHGGGRNNGGQPDYFLAQAELGSLRTTEAYLASRPEHTKDEARALVERYEKYASSPSYGEFVLDAYLRAANLSFHDLFDLERATKDYQAVVERAHGVSDKSVDAIFGLVDVAISGGNLELAATRLSAASTTLATRGNLKNQEPVMHLLYERALIDFYKSNFDSALAGLSVIIQNPASDFANDAISLSGTISENNKPESLEALKLYAQANYAEAQHNLDLALTTYNKIAETQTAAPVADDAALKAAEILLKLGKPNDAIHMLETMQEKMPSSPLLDVAAFRSAEIVERVLHDKARAQKMYEEFLEHFPKSSFGSEARNRARNLRGDAF
jgi:hypothetical protein